MKLFRIGRNLRCSTGNIRKLFQPIYNSRLSQKNIFDVFYGGNGRRDIVLSYYNDGKQFPLRGRSCSAQHIPEIKQAFPSYNAFAGATLTEVLDPLALDKSLQLSASGFLSRTDARHVVDLDGERILVVANDGGGAVFSGPLGAF